MEGPLDHLQNQIGWVSWSMKKIISLGIATAVFLTACATGPKVDWQSRVGHFTFDQAVVELGPPDKDATLTDGTRVCEWLTARSRSSSYVTGYRGFYSVNDASTPDYYLRLTFTADRQLQAWKKYAK